MVHRAPGPVRPHATHVVGRKPARPARYPYGSPMDVRWVPYSAALLAMGALAVLSGALLMPGGDAAESLAVVEQHDGRWLGVSFLLLVGSFALTLGLPSVYTLLRDRTPRFGLLALGIFAIGTIATCGYAMLLVFYRALVITESLNGPLEGVSTEVGIAAFLALFVGSFYLGELLVAIALFRAGSVARWIPAVMVAHVVSLGVGQVLPGRWQSTATVLLAVGLCGVAISANEAEARRPRLALGETR
jgi:hypothetical protein